MEPALMDLHAGNLATEHVCCALADKKSDAGIACKKTWLADRMTEGLVFRKLDQRGKVFIEYLPLDAAWVPVEHRAPDTTGQCGCINCLWVSGSFAGQGWAGKLLDSCIQDGRRRGWGGISVVAGDKKRPFLSDPGFLKHAGFRIVDQAAPYFRLWYLPLTPDTQEPRFADTCRDAAFPARDTDAPGRQGLHLVYSPQCPFTDFQVRDVESWCKNRGIPFSARKLSSRDEARNATAAWTTWAVWWQGEFLTHELLNASRAEKFLAGKI